MVLSALNIPLQIGDLVVSARNANGFIDVTKGVVINIKDNKRVTILGLSGQRFLYGNVVTTKSAILNISKRSIYGRMLVQVKELASQDPDFIDLLGSDKFKDLKL